MTVRHALDVADWRTTPCVEGRLATEEDVERGAAAFYAKKRHPEAEAEPYPMALPRCAVFRADGEGPAQPVVLIQAERLGDLVLVGFKNLAGETGICSLVETTLLDAPNTLFDRALEPAIGIPSER